MLNVLFILLLLLVLSHFLSTFHIESMLYLCFHTTFKMMFFRISLKLCPFQLGFYCYSMLKVKQDHLWTWPSHICELVLHGHHLLRTILNLDLHHQLRCHFSRKKHLIQLGAVPCPCLRFCYMLIPLYEFV